MISVPAIVIIASLGSLVSLIVGVRTLLNAWRERTIQDERDRRLLLNLQTRMAELDGKEFNG